MLRAGRWMRPADAPRTGAWTLDVTEAPTIGLYSA
jgi:hypothetical protein